LVEVRAGATVLALGSPKQRAVLAVLLLHANKVVPDERLVELVWGDGPPRSVKGRLQVHISELRALLGREVIVRQGRGYRIHVGVGALDLHEFLSTARQAREQLRGGATRAGARRLRRALNLWSGPALGGVHEPLVSQTRPVIEERRLSAQEDLFDAELAEGRHALVVDELREAVAAHPFRERFVAQLMLALSRCQRRTEALETYARTRECLVAQLGVEPGPELRATQTRILSGRDEPPPSRPADEPTRPLSILPAELPRSVPHLVGRAEAAREVDRVLHGSGGIAVITGAAGIGKTALAVHRAHRARSRFPDGQLHVDLRGFRPDAAPLGSGDALRQLLHSLGIRPDRVPDSLDARVALYRSLLAGRRMLVVLDDARDAAQVHPLLPASGSVLITSRCRLTELVAHYSAHPVPLDGLTDQESHELLEHMLGAHRLIGELPAAHRLVRLCAGLPAAVRIASARLAASASGSRRAIVEELIDGDRLSALTVGDSAQGSIDASLTGSVRTLTAEQRELLLRVALTPGPDVTLATATELAGVDAPETGRRLAALLDIHLLEQRGAGVYRVPELVRLYAARQGVKPSVLG
jgi:DNA-binding SARP family transcriptional activator